MQVLTLRTANSLPAAYDGLPEFFVRIGGEITRCTCLADARRAAAHFMPSEAVTLMTRGRLMRSIESSGYHVSGPTDFRAADDGAPVWVCNARAMLAGH